ncbi:MAG: DUF1273 domain-containing protein [Clostridiales bacterium]|nr:DUF1273 domain-containing protein [Clostridiales bacterium]
MINDIELRRDCCCFTGHLPEKLQSSASAIQGALSGEIDQAIAEGYTIFISGMARGTDLWAADLVLKAREKNPSIQLFCAIPYDRFAEKWPPDWQTLYYRVLTQTDDLKVFYPYFTYAAFQVRNRWMVDRSSRIIAVYNGAQGGTRHTLRYAEKRRTEIRCIRDCV